MPKQLLFFLALLCISGPLFAQTDTEPGDSIIKIPNSSIGNLYSAAFRLGEKLDKRSEKILQKIAKAEGRLVENLGKTDSIAAFNSAQNASIALERFKEKISNPQFTQYISRLDSISTSLKFLEAKPTWLGSSKDAKEKLENAIERVKNLETSLQKAEEIKKFIRERKQYLKEQFEKLGITKQFKRLDKEVYYYSQQLNEYKEALQNPKKAEKKILEVISKAKLFQDFMRKNSLLASLFRMPGDPNDPAYLASLSGLQTRAQVNSLIQAQLAMGGANATQQLRQNLQQTQSQFNQLKDKVLQSGKGSSDDDMPNFKPNRQKTKSFWKRLEYQTNIQSQKASNFFPVTSDIGLSLGYKLDNQSVIGFCASYKLGWGRGWRNISITHQGVGLRTFLDIHLKKALWISGGFEQNYRTTFTDFSQLQNLSAWQQSGLIGLSKSIAVKSKFFKKTKFQLLWDFLSYQQVPMTQAILFRIGYGFN